MLQSSLKSAAVIGAAFFFIANASKAAPGVKLGGGLEQMVQSFEQGNEKLSVALSLHLRDQQGNPLVRFVLADGVKLATVLPQLEASGFKLVAQSRLNPQLIEGYLPVGSARFAVGVPGIQSAVATHVPSKRVGKVTSQAVALEKANKAQAAGFDGTGLKIGALSDSFDACTSCSDHAADNEASGDLPATVTVLEDQAAGGGEDEGRAMLQLVHDLAPGAQLAFATAFGGEVDFANQIVALREDFGADVITDDVFYYDEPFYSDGLLAQAVNQASAEGAAYFSSAGNDGIEGYEATYAPIPFAKASQLTRLGLQNIKVDTIPAALRPISFHNFGNPDGSINLTNRYTCGSDDVVDMQWDEPFNMGLVKTDYNIYLFDAQGNWLDPNTSPTTFNTFDDNTQTDQALELAEMVPFSTDIHGAANYSDYQIVIGKMNNGPATHFKYITENALGVSRLEGAPTVNGHCAARGGVCVGATYYAIPSFPEDFSSGGPTTIYFDGNGKRLPHPEVRATPQMIAADGVDTTFFIASDPDATGFPNFFGTSAAAPDAAGVAALVLQAAGGPGSMKPSDVYAVMEETATPMALSNERQAAGAFAGPVVFAIKGDWTRQYHYFGASLLPFLGKSAHVKSLKVDTTNTPTRITISGNANRFNVDPASDVPQSAMTYTINSSTSFTITFAAGAWGSGQGFHFGTSAFAAIQGSVQEDADRFQRTKITVTLEDGHVFTGIVGAPAASYRNRFTGAGLVNAQTATAVVAAAHKSPAVKVAPVAVHADE